MARRSLDQYTPEVAHALSVELRRPGSKFELRPGQAAMLLEAAENGGLFSMLGVGDGKSVCAPLFGRVLGLTRVVLLVPPALKLEIVNRVIPRLLKEFSFIPPTVISYADLSSPKSTDLLARLRPELIVADEVHNLKARTAARTKRFIRFFQEFECLLVGMSGTATRRSLRDFFHILQLTHRGSKMPMTRHFNEMINWADALDPGVHESERLAPGALLELTRPGENAREGFSRRLLETEGVVGGKGEVVGASLIFRRVGVSTPPAVASALKKLREEWELPTGELVVDALDFYRKARELAQGFYYVWDWPNGIIDQEWLDARRDWRAAVASVTRLSRPGLDSELLVRNAAAREAGHAESEATPLPKASRDSVIEAFVAWAKVSDREPPPVRAVWVDDFLVRAAIAWAQENEDGIVWYDSKAFEEKIPLLWREASVCPAGTEGNRKIFALAESPRFEGGDSARDKGRNAGRPSVIFASATAHGTGKNLQRWSKNLLVAPPAGGATIEQLVGRTHRPGQEADEVQVDFFAHTPELVQALRTALEQSRYIEQVTAAKQKMLSGQWLGWHPEDSE